MATWGSDSVTVREEVENQTYSVPKLLIAPLLGAALVGSAGYFWPKRRRGS